MDQRCNFHLVRGQCIRPRSPSTCIARRLCGQLSRVPKVTLDHIVNRSAQCSADHLFHFIDTPGVVRIRGVLEDGHKGNITSAPPMQRSNETSCTAIVKVRRYEEVEWVAPFRVLSRFRTNVSDLG